VGITPSGRPSRDPLVVTALVTSGVALLVAMAALLIVFGDDESDGAVPRAARSRPRARVPRPYRRRTPDVRRVTWAVEPPAHAPGDPWWCATIAPGTLSFSGGYPRSVGFSTQCSGRSPDGRWARPTR
jgi:hypothetical protein